MAAAIGADSLRYLPLDAIARCLEKPREQLCQACIDAVYPTPAGTTALSDRLEQCARRQRGPRRPNVRRRPLVTSATTVSDDSHGRFSSSPQPTRAVHVDSMGPHEHEIPIRVRYCETDAMGFLHHANFLTYFEMGRTELFRAKGATTARWKKADTSSSSWK